MTAQYTFCINADRGKSDSAWNGRNFAFVRGGSLDLSSVSVRQFVPCQQFACWVLIAGISEKDYQWVTANCSLDLVGFGCLLVQIGLVRSAEVALK